MILECQQIERITEKLKFVDRSKYIFLITTILFLLYAKQKLAFCLCDKLYGMIMHCIIFENIYIYIYIYI